MKNPRSLRTVLSMVFVLACLNVAVMAQSADEKGKSAAINANGLSVRWDMNTPSEVSLTISAPDGRIFHKEFAAGGTPEFTLIDQGERLPDGEYTYELRSSSSMSSLTKKSLAAMRGNDDDAEAVRASRKRPELSSQSMVQSGSFSIINGSVVVAGGYETVAPRPDTAQPRGPRKIMEQSRVASPSTPAVSKVRQHHLAFAMPDQVIPDDLIVQGSACIGLDCVNNESFGFDTIRLKENNTRIKFDDTSTSAGFSANDWQLTANDSASGGASKFSIEDITGSKVPFTIRGGAATNSIFVDSTGRLGLRTGAPVLDIHVATSNTPAIRLEQNNSGGFTAQTWDIAGNEANFFVRDVTGGSRLPFRIRPGAPTSSVDISADGDVGVGTASPNSLLHLHSGTRDLELRLKDAGSTATGDVGVQLRAGSGAFLGLAANGGTAIGIVIDNSNRVGIATDAPTDTLSVNGTASKPGGGSWAVFSDERLKNIKGPFNTGLKAVMQLQPIRYQYKSNNALGLASAPENIGFGAQTLQKVIPEAVTSTSNGYLQVNNDPILWTMLNAIKEQQAEIDKLKGEIRQLKSRSPRRK